MFDTSSAERQEPLVSPYHIDELAQTAPISEFSREKLTLSEIFEDE